jgi:hypothetical protein
VALGLVAQTLIRRRVLANAAAGVDVVPLSGKLLACSSLLLWAAVITSGRLLAYTYVKLTTI